jgi:CheY-like chemotaxis protein
VDTDGLVAGLADLIRRTVGPGIALDLRLRDGAGSVLCDPNELESALLNLCINARDAMAEGGRLTIATEDLRLSAADVPDDAAKPGPYVALSVADTGTGMPPDVLERVFEPFFTTKPRGQGTGLGLSQVWGFVRQSGGLVRVESAPGRGTTVRLLLPLHEHADAMGRPEAAVPPAPDGGGEAGTVLLVDDEDAARQPAADRLRELGYTVLEARDGPEALRILATTRPDLLVTDVGLPNGMNGRQLAEAARDGVPGLPVLFISGYAGMSLPPVIDMIDKPFELDMLVRRVRMALEVDRRTGADRHRGA